MSDLKPMPGAAKMPLVKYSPAYSTIAERYPVLQRVEDSPDAAVLTSDGCFSAFRFGGDTIRRESPWALALFHYALCFGGHACPC